MIDDANDLAQTDEETHTYEVSDGGLEAAARTACTSLASGSAQYKVYGSGLPIVTTQSHFRPTIAIA